MISRRGGNMIASAADATDPIRAMRRSKYSLTAAAIPTKNRIPSASK